MLRASCHCGAVVLELARRPRELTRCNCSICRRYCALWAYCSRSRARVVQKRRSLVRYVQEGRKREFWRCKICGCVTHHQRLCHPSETTATEVAPRATFVQVARESSFGQPTDRRYEVGANASWCSGLTVTRRNVAGIDVVPGAGLWFWLSKSAASSFCSSAPRPFFSAASNAFIVGP